MKGETIRIDVYVSRADERLNAFNRFSICSASTSGYFFGRASNRSIHFVTILVGDTRRMEVKDHEDKWQRHNIPLWCWSPVPMYWCAFDILLWIRRRQRRWQLQHCWLFQSLVYTHVKRMYAVCAPRASLLNKQDEKSKKRLGMRITFITIYSTYTLNLMVLLIFLNCWLFFFLSVSFGPVALVRCPSSMHCRPLRVPFADMVRAIFRSTAVCLFFRHFIVDLWEIHGAIKMMRV